MEPEETVPPSRRRERTERPAEEAGSPESAAGNTPAAERAPTLRSTRAQTLSASLIGRDVGPYHVEEKLGEGGMGVVFRAVDRALDRVVALKILFEIDEDANVQRFLVEAKALARLTHPNAIHIFWTGEFEGYPCFAMEFIADGISVYDLLRHKGMLEVDDAVDIVIDAAKGLAAARRAGIVHRDIKPNNLLIDADGTVKISDFGLAKIIEDSGHLTQSGIVMGTPYYMSPEQGQGEAIDHRADLYSLGATFYHMVTGFTPYEAQNPVSLIIKHVKDPIPDIRAVNPQVPDAIRKIIETCLEKSPDRRYQEYEDLIEDLEAFKAGRAPKHAEAARKTSRLPPWVWFGAGLGIAAASFVGVWKYSGDTTTVAVIPTATATPFVRISPSATPSAMPTVAAEPGEVERARADMGSGDAVLRARAAAVLGKLALPDTLPELVKLSQDSEPRVRARAAWALGRLPGDAGVKPLLETLRDRDTSVVLASVMALDDRSTPEVVEPLQAIAETHGDAAIRRAAAAVVEKVFLVESDSPFGIRKGSEWREDFRGLANRIALARARHADAERTVRYLRQRWGFTPQDKAPPAGSTPEARRAFRGIYTAAQRTLTTAETQVKAAESARDTLVAEADVAKVPPEWRR